MRRLFLLILIPFCSSFLGAQQKDFERVTGNQMITLELLDGAFFPRKQSEEDRLVGYISIKAGFRNIFS
ncbi:hypothetical protein [Agriterribacter sp.]|uniref:hypothetical protein n=1 Tax=Agriterribacter sp. TaxID=2821509 RepID=UPI002BF95F1D|nr:hypothetical protein [Agriterribacter sp.]HTN08252.1 hypothetical protein [Agriterribacter sp.]